MRAARWHYGIGRPPNEKAEFDAGEWGIAIGFTWEADLRGVLLLIRSHIFCLGAWKP